jgi:hypothetical protein
MSHLLRESINQDMITDGRIDILNYKQIRACDQAECGLSASPKGPIEEPQECNNSFDITMCSVKIRRVVVIKLQVVPRRIRG